MTNMNATHSTRKRSRGIALITTLLLLSLFTVMTLAMVIATTSDTLIDGYYNNFRGSFYASDSGLNAARQFMLNQFAGSISGTWTPAGGTAPISAGQETTIRTALVNTSTGFGSYNSITGSQTGSWPGKFEIDSTAANTYINTPNPLCTVAYTGTTTPLPTCTSTGSTSDTITSYSYTYPYQITVLGEARNNEQNKIVENGSIVVTVPVTSSTTTAQSFAAWGMFIDQSPICNGSYLVAGTISGPVFTNGAWNFGTSGSYIFTDSVGSVSGNIGYQFGSCYQSGAHSYSSGGQSIAPQFKGAVNLGQTAVSLPTNSYNQEEAVLDGKGDGSTSVTNATMNTYLKKQGDTAYPSGGTSTGVYLPYSVTTVAGVTTRTMTGGGILVQGNANSVTLTAGTSGGHKTQVVTITQGSSTITTTTITYDLDGGTTTLTQKVGSGFPTTTTINGLPENLEATPVTEGAMVYVNGTITSLTGPSSGAAIQDTSAVTVVAAGDVNITGNLTYKTEPVTTSGSTPDTLISGNNNGQVFGIFTAGGNINLNMASSGQNLEIDASIAAISQGGSGGLVNTGQAINQLTIVGGRIQNTIQNINSTTRNVWFDRRFAQGGFAPPWFPSTSVTVTGAATYSTPVVTANRVSWVNTTAE